MPFLNIEAPEPCIEASKPCIVTLALRTQPLFASRGRQTLCREGFFMNIEPLFT